MLQHINIIHNLTFLHHRPLFLSASNKKPKTVQALSALMGLVRVPHKDIGKVKTGLLDVLQPHADFVVLSVFAEGVDNTDSDVAKPEFVVMFVEGSNLLEMRTLSESKNGLQLVSSSDNLPFAPTTPGLLMFKTASLNDITNYIVVPTTPMTLTEVVIASLVNVEFVEKED